MSKFKKEWELFRQDFKRQADASFMFRLNWYVLKPIAIILVLIAFSIL
jgi:hypothetical protein|tara:strand:+ start:1322 stop:1465 length:144 start_codon:yes stop_codon:yes gene_type:complete